VVRAGSGAVEDLEAFVLAVGDGGDELFEGGDVELAGAGAGDEESVGSDELEGEFVEVVIFGVADLVLAAVDEFWWVGDDEVPGAAVFEHGAGPGEGVGVGELDADVVEVGVAFCHGDGGFIEVDADDFLRATEGGCDGESAGVGAEIEDGFAVGEGAEFLAVVALVAEESSFVAGGEVDFVADAVFADFHATDGIGFGAAGAWDAFDACEFGVDADDDAACAEGFVHEWEPGGEALPCGEVGDFHGEDVGEFVGDEAGEEIGVAVDDAVAVGIGIEFEDVVAESGGLADGVFEKGFVEIGFGVADDAEGHAGLWVPESPAEGSAFLAEDLDERAGSGVARDVANHFGPDGGVEALVFELDGGHGGDITPQRRADVE